MEQNNKVALQAASPYNAAITREQFYFMKRELLPSCSMRDAAQKK